MSNLGYKLLHRTEQMGSHRVAVIEPISTAQITNSYVEIDSRPEHIQVDLGVTFRVRSIVKAHSEDMARAKRIMRRQIIEEVFGEFRRPLCELDVLIGDYKIKEAHDLVQKIMEQMFNEEQP